MKTRLAQVLFSICLFSVMVGSQSVALAEDSQRSSVVAHDYEQEQGLALLGVYCLLIVGASLAGGILPSLINLTHTRMQLMMSFVGGLMLGIGVFHMLPHAFEALGSIQQVALWLMIGLVTMFFLIRAFHFHQHGPAEVLGHDHDHDHDQDCDDAQHHGHGPDVHELNWLGVALGLAVHTLIDGMALAAAVRADASHGALWSLFGLQTFLAVLLHKPLDAVSITSLMAAGGWTVRARHFVNAGFAAMCPLGAVLFVLGLQRFSDHQATLVGCALAFSAGVFLCISLSDLLPEMELHSHNRIPLSIALLAGILLAYGIEQTHESSHKNGASGVHQHTIGDDAAR
jgi:zinc and cadmium transporter